MLAQTAIRGAGKPLVKTPRHERGAFAYRRVYTYADCLTWPENFRAEIVNGDVFIMPSPILDHQWIISILTGLIMLFCKKHPQWRVYPAPLDVRFYAKPDNSDTFVFQPDVVVVKTEAVRGKRCVEYVPEMLIEVLSPSNISYDKKVKFEHYESAGVKEYWIVDSENKTIEVNVLEDGEYATAVYNAGETIPATVLDGLTINLDDVFTQE